MPTSVPPVEEILPLPKLFGDGIILTSIAAVQLDAPCNFTSQNQTFMAAQAGEHF